MFAGAPPRAGAQDAFEQAEGALAKIRERVEVHGFGEVQLRALSENYHPDRWVMSQWANVLNVEVEASIAPDGWGPFDLISAFSRIEVRYECVYRGCGLPTWRYWGNRANQAPVNLTDGKTNPFSGILEAKPKDRITPGNNLVDFFVIPPFEGLRNLGGRNLEATFAPIADARYAVKNIDASIGNGIFNLGPWLPKNEIDPVGSLASIPNITSALPMRPEIPDFASPRSLAHGLYVPSRAFDERRPDYDGFDQNLRQQELIWNHGGAQDERELKEAYLDLEAFDGRLWMRVGKQAIVWGKTELFRTTDQFNPQDLALSSLPSLEESRIALWSARAVWSFYDVGPLEDLRAEVAVNFDDFEPLDLGQCGEPYTIWLVCGKRFGLWAHGFSGVGIAGEDRPPDPGDSLKGWEIGGRVEFRAGRFSFQLSDFYGYDDAPVIDYFNAYERRVDPTTGRPLDVDGNPLLPTQSPEHIVKLHPGNRQLFDVVCSATLGIAETVLPQLADSCLVDLLNADETIALGLDPPGALGLVLAGTDVGETVAAIIAFGTAFPPVPLVELNVDPGDGPGSGSTFSAFSLSARLTPQQEALIGCGEFYGTNCDDDGLDLFNAEASVLLQSFPQFEPDGAVATRPVRGRAVTLPGARGPQLPNGRANPEYDPLQDGCIAPSPGPCAAAHDLGVNPVTGRRFQTEMAALSYNFLQLLAALGSASPNDPDCDITDPITCAFVRGVFDVAGATRPEVRAGGNGAVGRRDFVWLGGSELQIRYVARNVLGLAFDFAEDLTKTNWSVEATWIANAPFATVDSERGFARNDTFNLTLSVDRPTFINFLNPGRTFFFNSQWFLRYIRDYQGGGAYVTHGPFSALATFTALTGYHQDRLLPSLTVVHDFRSFSGAVIAQVAYRFSTEFSATLGIANFYGRPDELPVPLRQVLPTNVGRDYEALNRYDGLTPIAERDEVFLLLRYTF